MKLTPDQQFHLRGIAKQLPVILTDTHEKHLVKGKDILEWNTITEIDGQPIDPDKEYLWHYPVQMYHNHYRRLKRAYIKEDMKGIYDYLSKINRIWKENNNGKGLGAFMALQSFLNEPA
jgi:hypothetical protein